MAEWPAQILVQGVRSLVRRPASTRAVRLRRMLARHLVNANPTRIVIRRTTTTADGAGGMIRTTVDEPRRVRLHMAGASGARARDISRIGGMVLEHGWGLLADHANDVQPGDTFTYGGQEYRVEEVWVRRHQGAVVAFQATLREVS